MIEIIEKFEDIEEFFKVLNKRANVSSGDFSKTVKDIIADVIENKDEALAKYTKKFDDENFDIKNMEVSKEEQKKCYESLSKEMQEVLFKAKERIYDYHLHQKRETFEYVGEYGEILGQKITPIENVGVYVPGGKASYPSSVIMNIMPAKVAGVKNITMVTPAVKGYINPMVLAAAYVCEADHVYKVGGAQAIAALAYGTETIKKVDKIVGPGNIFVALAKREVYGTVGIDSIAGPSEVCIIANETSNPSFVAADLLAQAEHDKLASSTVFVTSYDMALKIKEETIKFYNTSSRKEILDSSLTNYSKIVVVKNLDEAIKYANRVAPEHLELSIDNARDYIDDIKNAGAIFLGHYSVEALGDYMAGPNHVLPTVGTARFFSPLGVDDFIKKTSLLTFDKESASKLVKAVDAFATSESLEMHALSARLRGEK